MLVPLADAGFGPWLQAWAGTVQAVATMLLLPILLLYVRKAGQTAGASARLAASAAEAAESTKVAAQQSQEALRELQAARAAESAPYVIAYLDITEEHLVYAVVKNIGRSPARNVSIHFDPPLIGGERARDWDVPAFLSSAIPFFPPQYELRSILGVSLDLFSPGSGVPTEYQARIDYTDASDQTAHAETYTLDLGIFRNARSGHATTLTDIQSILRELGDGQRSLADGMDAMRDLLSEPPGAPLPATDQPPSAWSLAEAAPPEAARAPAGKGGTDLYPASLGGTAVAAGTAKMQELCSAWRSLSERRRWESAGMLQQRLRDLQGTESPADPILIEILQHRFFLDGGESLRDFDQVVDRLLSAMHD